jgi:hypothetical protein
MKKKIIRMLALTGAITFFVMPFTSGYPKAYASDVPTESTTAAAEPWVVKETTYFNSLTINEGSSIKAPDGYSVTLTVNGVETSIKPGSYRGEVMLTVAKDIIAIAKVFGTESRYYLRTAVYVEDGAYVPEKSVSAAITSGDVTNSSAKDLKISSVGDNFNGIIVRTSDTNNTPFTYTINNPSINFTGNGGNDFVGYGAAVMSSGYADVTVNKANIVTNGVIRSAFVVNNHSTLRVNDSYIHTGNPTTLPRVITGMMEVPWMLGLTGTCRSTMACDNATVYYTNTHIVAEGWGALSTDNVQSVKLNVTKSIIDVVQSGYGAYADGSSVDTFSGCTFNVKDMALIMTQGSGVFTDGTVVNSGRFGVMAHSGFGGNTLTINNGSVFNTKEAVIQLKSSNPTVIVDNAKLNPENGIILQAMINDDPDAGGGAMGAAGGAAPAASGGTQGGAPGGSQGGAGQGGAPAGGMPAKAGVGGSDVPVTFRNMTMKGDIINSMTTLGDVIVKLENVTITGAITTARAVPAVAKASKDNYKLIGVVTNTYCATDDKYGMKVSLDGKSSWIVEKTSYLTGLTIADGSKITAPKGSSVTMTVDGSGTAIKSGSYKGKIVLTITKNA